MVGDGTVVFGAAIALGVVHGAEPGHGWPIAATYALDRRNKWLNGFVASSLLGLGHLVSSLAVVGAFFLGKEYLELTELNEPLEVLGLEIGGPLGVVAGVLLIGLGVREYRRGHRHGNGGDHDHHQHAHGLGHHQHVHGPGHLHAQVPDRDGGPGHDDDHTHGDGHVHDGDRPVDGHGRPEGAGREHDVDSAGLGGLVWTAFVLGFVHEEEFEIIGLCIGSVHCLELMVVYAIAVLVTLVCLTMALIAGYYRYEERVERLAAYFPAITATVLVTVGGGFLLGVL